MSFLKNLFGRKSASPKKHVDERGMYFHVECQKCSRVLRVRIDKTYDINREENGYTWRKTLVCDKCFQKMETEMLFDGKYNVVAQEIHGGKYVEPPAEASESDGARGFG